MTEDITMVRKSEGPFGTVFFAFRAGEWASSTEAECNLFFMRSKECCVVFPLEWENCAVGFVPVRNRAIPRSRGMEVLELVEAPDGSEYIRMVWLGTDQMYHAKVWRHLKDSPTLEEVEAACK